MATRYLVLLLVACVAYGDDKHLICKQVGDIFSAENPPTSTPTRVIAQGRAGKRGSPGVKGERGDLGPPGPPAVVNYAQIQESVERNVSSEITALLERIKDLEKAVTVENCDIYYIGKCFRAILHDTSDVSLAAAKTMCRDIGWELANVYDSTHDGKIREYLRSKIPSSRTWNTAWLGMTINPRTKEMRYSNGTVASDVGFQWHLGHPSSGTTFTKIGIHINKDPASRDGIHSWPIRADYMRLGPICEI